MMITVIQYTTVIISPLRLLCSLFLRSSPFSSCQEHYKLELTVLVLYGMPQSQYVN